MSRVPTEGIDYTSRDYEGFRQSILQHLGINMPEYTDHSQTDAGVVIIEGVSKALDVLSYYSDVIANETLLPTLKRRDSANKWCSILSYSPKQSTPSRVMQVFTLTKAQDTDTLIPAGTSLKTMRSVSEPEVLFETLNDLVIPAGKLGDEKSADGKYLYSVIAIQGVSVTSEKVGSSNGTPNQKFPLNYSPVIQDSMFLLVNEGSGFEPWTRVPNFVDSNPSSKHYTMSLNDNNEALIMFGDGTFGKIPAKLDSGIFADYRIGGGEQGNVGANKIVVLDASIALVSSTYNPEPPYIRGLNKETIEQIKINAPKASDLKWGALTLADFSDVVLLNFPEVVFASSAVDKTDTDSVHIYMLTRDGAVISEVLRKELTDFFDINSGGRVVVGVNKVYLETAKLVGQTLVATLVVKDRYSRAAVTKEVKSLVENYFALGNYNFSKELSLSELSSLIMSQGSAIDGIKSFFFTSPTTDIITPKEGEIFTLTSFTVNASGGVE